MKKLIILLLALAMILCSCSQEEKQNPLADKTCEEIINAVYDTAVKTDTLENVREWAETKQITSENCKWFLGVEDVPFELAYASESPMSPSNYSFCIVKLKSDADYASVEKKISDNIDPMKWVCMGAEKAEVARIDNVICVIMGTAETVSSVIDAFMNLGKAD